MAKEAVRKKNVSVALACRAFDISETCRDQVGIHARDRRNPQASS
jgi:hypothetical protein